ncbi:MAG: FmdB family zinc ribbon protein [Planctomycetota bacterium]
MPLYEYLCHGCDKQIEVLVRSASEKPACPHCEDSRLTRLLSVPAEPVSNAGGPLPDGQMPDGPCGSACGCFPAE